MVTPKEKAKELQDKMHLFTSGDIGNGDLAGANAKQCALICINEKIEFLKYFFGAYNTEDEWFDELWNRKLKELEEVKSEIQNL